MLADLFERRAIRDTNLWNAWARGDDIIGGNTSSGISVTESSALGLLAVYSAVRVITDAVVTLPLDVYRRHSGIVEEIPAPTWLRKPNTDDDLIAYLTQIMVSLLLRGNAYVLVTRNSTGQVLELWPVHPDLVSVRKNFAVMGGKSFTINGQAFNGEIMHIPGMMLPGALIGVDPITYVRDALGLGIAAQTYGAKFFAQGAMPSGVISSPGIVTTEQAKELKERWLAMHGGTSRAQTPAVLTGGATYTAISITPEQAQFLETRRFSDEQIYRLFGLGSPLSSAAGANITYANIESHAADIVRYTLGPWIARLESAHSTLLPNGQYVKLNVDAFQRAEAKARAETYKVLIEAGIINANEAREKEDLAPRPGGEVFTVPTPSQTSRTPVN